MAEGAYAPHEPAKRPGGRPGSKPRYRVLVNRKFRGLWERLPTEVGLESAQQFWDHVANQPGSPPDINRVTILKGTAGKPRFKGGSRTHHYEISGAGRINYCYHNTYKTSPKGDEHKAVFILTIDLGSH